MQKLKKVAFMIIFILIINLVIPVYADDELEEASVTIEEMEEILEAATEITEMPSINSRNAIVYDRTSRENIIRKTRKYKM